MPKVLLISLSELHRDPRVLRQFTYFTSRGYDVYLLGYSSIEGAEKFVPIREFRTKLDKVRNIFNLVIRNYSTTVKLWKKRFQYDKEEFKDIDFSLIVVNDIQSLPFAQDFISEDTKIWVDLHEYTPLQMEQDLVWKTFFSPYYYWYMRRYLPEVDYVTTVTESLQNSYQKEIGIDLTTTLINAPQKIDNLSPKPVDIFNIKLVHHGIASRSRGLNILLDIMYHLGEGYELHLYLATNSKESEKHLRELQEDAERRQLSIVFHDIVPTDKIPYEINQYDAQMMFISPRNFNYIHGIGNKFFESVQARLAIISAPLAGKIYYIDKYNLGIYTSDFNPKTIASEIKNISLAQWVEFKAASDMAHEELSSDSNYKKMDQFLGIEKAIHGKQ